MNGSNSLNNNNYPSNFFSSDEYLSTLAQVYFPNKKFTIELFEINKQFYRLLVIDNSKVINSFPFLDFLQEINPPEKTAKKINYIPKAVIRTKTYTGDDPSKQIGYGVEFDTAPFIDWTNFNDWGDFEKLIRQRSKNLIYDSKRRLNKLTQEHGSLKFIFDDKTPEALDTCIRWKSGHYEKIGGAEIFLDPNDTKMFKELQKKCAIILSTLSVKDKIIAAVIGAISDGVYYYWIPSYTRAFSSFAPGRLLLHFLLHESFTRKDKTFDFLIGGEEYKWHYVTHYRIIGPIGHPPLSEKLRKILTHHRYNLKRKSPATYYSLKRLIISFKKLMIHVNKWKSNI